MALEEWEGAYIAALEQSGDKSRAAREAGVNRKTVDYNYRRREAFRERVDRALPVPGQARRLP